MIYETNIENILKSWLCTFTKVFMYYLIRKLTKFEKSDLN